MRINFFEKNISEISKDKALMLFGLFLNLTHILSYITWTYGFRWYQISPSKILEKEATAICWPYFQECYKYRFFSESQIDYILISYLIASIICCLSFLRFEKFIKFAYYSSLALFIFKLIIFLSDYQIRANQHIIIFLVSIFYLFIPSKRTAIKFLIIGFYFWAGVLKMDKEWLTGAGIRQLENLWIPKPLVPVSLYGMLLVEILGSWFLLSKNKVIFYSTFSMVILSHIISWSIVVFFFPTIMFCLLSIFILDKIYPQKDKISWQSLILMGFICVMQIIPYLKNGDPVLNGEFRHLSFNMFDAQPICKGEFKIEKMDGTFINLKLNQSFDEKFMKDERGDVRFALRIRCNPIVSFNRAKRFCRRHDIKSIGLVLDSKRKSDVNYTRKIDLKNVCHSDIEYKNLTHNSWILN